MFRFFLNGAGEGIYSAEASPFGPPLALPSYSLWLNPLLGFTPCNFQQKNRPFGRFVFLERAKGFEPSTSTLARLRSTPELHPHFVNAR